MASGQFVFDYIIPCMILLQNAETSITIREWRRAAETYCGPERHLTTNVAAGAFTTAANTYVAMANSSRKENEASADSCVRLVRGDIEMIPTNIKTNRDPVLLLCL